MNAHIASPTTSSTESATSLNVPIDNSKSLCNECGSHFRVKAADKAFYERVGLRVNSKKFAIPAPEFCPTCRRKRRRAFRNQTSLYMRECDLTGRRTISNYHPDKRFPVFHREVWWEKKRRGLDFGREFDFNKSFFEQFEVLQSEVPIESSRSVNCDNSEFCNNIQDCKNCYMLVGSKKCNDCSYLDGCTNCSNSALAWKCDNLQLCYHIYQSSNLFHCFYSELCFNCSDVRFSRLCFDCHHCFGCVNLKHKKYCIFNKQYSKEEYFRFINRFKQGSYRATQKAWKQTKEFRKTVPARGVVEWNNENCEGDIIFHSKDCEHAFTIEHCEGSHYLYDSKKVDFSQDLDNASNCEGLCYQVVQSSQLFHTCFAVNSHGCSDSFYAMDCYRLSHCFGNVGLYQERYCILNKRYSKKDYFILLEKIILHMKKTGEWGKMFPPHLSRFGYHESSAKSDFPMSKEECIDRGYSLSDFERKTSDGPHIEASELPDHIRDVGSEIVGKKIKCPETDLSYKIQSSELKLYKKLNVPLPREAFPRSLKNVRTGRNKMYLYKRNCLNTSPSGQACGNEVKSTFPFEESQLIFCDNCQKRVAAIAGVSHSNTADTTRVKSQ